MAQAFHYQDWPIPALEIKILIQIIVVGLFLFILIQIGKKYIEKRTRPLKLLAILIGCLAIAVLLGTVPIIIRLINPYEPWLNGIPIGIGSLALWWTNLSYVFIAIGTLALYRFIEDIFEKPSHKYFPFFALIVGIFIGWDVYRGIFIVVPGITSLSSDIGALFLGIQILVWGLLYYHSRQLYRRLDPSVYQVSVKIIAISALCTMASFGFYVVGNLVQNLILEFNRYVESVYWCFIVLTVFLLYIGYVIPTWLKKRVENRVGKGD